MIKKKNKLNIPLILCAVFVSVISCFAFFNFNKKGVAYADSSSVSYRFDGSNIYLPVNRPYTNQIDYVIYRNSFYFSNDTGLFTVDISDSLLFFNKDSDTDPNFRLLNFYAIYGVGSSLSYFTIEKDYFIDYPYQYREFGTLINNVRNSYRFYFNMNSADFNCDISSITLDCQYMTFMPHVLSDDGERIGAYFNIITYYDTNDNYFQILTPLPDVLVDDAGLDYRVYFVNDFDEFSDSQIYNKGFSDGLLEEQPRIYNEGYNAGHTTGYYSGFSDGAESTNQYTFLNLVSATIDAPFHYFRSLFGFELLGVNLQDFLMALFTICVVITIINLVRR